VRNSRIFLSLVAVATLAAPATSGAAAARPRPAPPRRAQGPRAQGPWQLASARSRPRGAREQFRTALGSARAPRLGDLLRLRRDLLLAPATAGGSGLKPILDEQSLASLPAEGTLSAPVLARDFDADGIDEVLVAEYTVPDSTPPLTQQLTQARFVPVDIVLRRGGDGGELWRATTDADGAYTLADVTGDGVLEIVLAETRVIPLDAGATLLRLQQTTRVLDGRTGAERWHYQLDGAVAAAGASSGLAAAYVVAAKDLVVAVARAGDANADGAPDLLVGSVDLAFAQTDSLLSFAADSVAEFTGTTLSGTDGRVLAAARALGHGTAACSLACAEPDSGTLPWIAPGGDLDGDGRADLLVTEGLVSSTLSGRSSDGATNFWTAPIHPDAFALSTQLDGARAPDVVVFENYSAGVVRALNGADGAQMWSVRAENLFDFALLGDVDGDGGQDLYMLHIVFPPGEDAVITGDAVSGARASALWSHDLSVHAPDADHFPLVGFCSCPADLTGDGLTDQMTATIVVDTSFNVVSQKVYAFSGADGASLWDSGEFPANVSYPLPLGGDANGNGAGDLVEFGYPAFGTTTPAELILHDGADYAPMWGARIPRRDLSAYHFNYDAYGGLAANLSGDAASEVVVGGAEFGCGEEACAIFTNVYGEAPGATLWTL
jgi:hypothetical protein